MPEVTDPARAAAIRAVWNRCGHRSTSIMGAGFTGAERDVDHQTYAAPFYPDDRRRNHLDLYGKQEP